MIPRAKLLVNRRPLAKKPTLFQAGPFESSVVNTESSLAEIKKPAASQNPAIDSKKQIALQNGTLITKLGGKRPRITITKAPQAIPTVPTPANNQCKNQELETTSERREIFYLKEMVAHMEEEANERSRLAQEMNQYKDQITATRILLRNGNRG